MDDLDDEIVQEFLIESHENLDQLDQDLVALEQDPTSRELLGGIFRTIHTIKGTSGFLAFHKLESITHVGESLLAKLRDGVITLTPEMADALLRMSDLVRALLVNIESRKTEGDTDVEPLAQELRELLELEVAIAEGTAPARAAAIPKARTPVAEVPEAEIPTVPADVDPAVDTPVVAAPAVTAPAVQVPVADTKEPDPPAPDNDGRSGVSDSTIRVDVNLLEQLVRLTGELVLARNQILQQSAALGNEALTRACHRLNLVTGELQEGVMRTRMQPIDHIWSKLPRVVRDLSMQLGKTVRLEMEGGDTELDRTLLEAVKDPLTHLVRNAIDHGIERPADRLATGKSETGVLRLRAAHEGGQVLLEISDDGKGLHPDVLRRKALEKNLITQAAADSMSDQELLKLVFVAGFSTAAAVTNVSGRGVGMDVVRTNIERIGGSIDVDSTPGSGTSWRMRIPLTLAIMPALTIECCAQRFALPQVNLLELVSLNNERAGSCIESVGGAEVYRLRGTLLPLVRLEQALGLVRSAEAAAAGMVVAVLEADGRRFGLVVDRVLDTEEIVVKPLAGVLKEIGLFAGATVLGDGAVSLILDVQSLARQQLHSGEIQDKAHANDHAFGAGLVAQRQFLVVGLEGDRRVAMPLEIVTRLEQFPVADLQHVGSRDVVRYRGDIMPVVRLSEHLGCGYSTDGDTIPGVVYSSGGRSVALIVKEIVDIVSEAQVVHSDVEDPGLIGSALIRDRVAEMLDVRKAILAADPMYFGSGQDEAVSTLEAPDATSVPRYETAAVTS